MNLLNLLSNFLILLWTPALLHGAGATPSQAIFVTSIYGLGIILGALLTAFLADRFWLERVLTYTAAFGALCPLSICLPNPRFWGAFGHDLWLGSGYWRLPGRSQRPIGQIYPPTIRSTGAAAPWVWAVSAPLPGRSWVECCWC
jgi:MFS family permease